MELSFNKDKLEAGVDEVARGPLFGRVYAAAVIFPSDITINPKLVKDSKRFTSHNMRMKSRKYIMDNCISFGISYCEADEIDKIGIVKCVMKAMHNAISLCHIEPEAILVDGDRFDPYLKRNTDGFEFIPHNCAIKADNKYYNVAAASILAKTEHDNYIADLVKEHPILATNYDIGNNVGYGTAKHMAGVRTHGLTQWHRKTFCRGT